MGFSSWPEAFVLISYRHQKKKIIVFLSSCNCVDYFSELLNYIDLPVLALHGKQKQQKRTNTFFEFCNAEHGTLICTDVAARGLDIPAVDWILQVDPPGMNFQCNKWCLVTDRT
jgi:ATP-dependent RNA helicase DDX18/HAS1